MEKNTIDHMEELKQQFAILTDKLEAQEINNERLFRTVMKTKMNKISNILYWRFVLVLSVVIWCFLYFYQTGQVSLFFFVFTVVIVILDFFLDWLINTYKNRKWQEYKLLETRRYLLQMKKKRNTQLFFSIPVLAVWGIFFVLELIHYDLSNKLYAVALIVILAIGMLIGLGIELNIYKKMQRTNDELIQEIDQLKKDLSDK